MHGRNQNTYYGDFTAKINNYGLLEINFRSGAFTTLIPYGEPTLTQQTYQNQDWQATRTINNQKNTDILTINTHSGQYQLTAECELKIWQPQPKPLDKH